MKNIYTIIILLFIASTNFSDVSAFETGNDFIGEGWNFSHRLMQRYKQMGNNEHITYPARTFGVKKKVSDAQARKILAAISKTVTIICESMYGHYGFQVKSVTFTLQANNQGAQEYGDPYPLNVRVDDGWYMGFHNNFLSTSFQWANSNNPQSNGSLFHEFGHHFLLYHLDLNDSDIPENGYFPRSIMDSDPGDHPLQYNMLGGDDLVGIIHMYRYSKKTNKPTDVPKCPKHFDLKKTGVSFESYPHNEPYPDHTWRCDPNLKDIRNLQIKNKENKKCLKGDGNNDETNISTAYCDSNDKSQRWDFLADDDGSYRIKNVANGKCMQIKDNSLSDGISIEQYSCNSASSQNAIQKFYLLDADTDLYSIRSEWSGRFFQISNNGIIQNIPNGETNQRWILSKTEDDNDNNDNDDNDGNNDNDGKKYRLKVRKGDGSGKYSSNTIVTIKAKDSSKFEKWQVVKGNPTITNINSANTTLIMPSNKVVIKAISKKSRQEIGCGVFSKNDEDEDEDEDEDNEIEDEID